ncbi:MAG: DivIVA domain-containing protein, partial [Deltaproteobacteria bacterium]|nr:DivIVA domain-containing protein [Deltaproteobacteria bacterium]
MRKMTPLDIQHKQFDKQFRGFNVQQVQSFLQDVVAYAEDLHKAVTELTQETESQKKRIQELELNEREIKETMQTAQRMTEQIGKNAQKESELIIQQAEMQAEKILKQAHDRLTEVISQINDIKKQK